MKNVLFFSSHIHKKDIVEKWKLFFNRFINEYGKCNIILLVETLKSKNLLQAELNGDIKVISINDNIDIKKKVSFKKKNEISKKYFNTDLRLSQLLLNNSNNSLFYNNRDKFEDILSIHIDFYEKFFVENKIDAVCLEVIEAYSSINILIIEAVCKILNILIIFPQRSGPWGRINIYNNAKRISEQVQRFYEKKIKSGLTDYEKDKILKYFKKYINYKESEKIKKVHFHDRIKKTHFLKSLTLENIKSEIKKKFLISINDVKKFYSNKNIYDNFDFKNRKYVLFLPNKINNYRTNIINPYYSSFSSIVKNISISLPLTHSLLVKDHPHSFYGKLDYNMFKVIKENCNCYYIDPRIEINEIIKHTDIIFSVASTSGVEALMHFKHVVYFGEEPYIFGKYNTPIKRVINIEDLPEIIRDCLENPPSQEQIIAYMYSILSCSYSRTEEIDDNDWGNIKHFVDPSKLYLKVALILSNYLKHRLK